LQNGVAMAAVMKAMGIQACRTLDIATGILPYVTTSSAHVSIGCEQVAVLAASLDQTTRAIQCTVSRVSQSSNQQIIAVNNITISLSGNAVITCIYVDQNINLKIASTVDFNSDITTAMASDLSASIKNFANVVQTANKDALSTPQGNKTASLFSTQLQQTAFQGSFEEIIQTSIKNFHSGNTFTLTLTGYSMIGLLNPPPNLLTAGCLVVNQNIVMQVYSQTILDNIMSRVFDTELASEWSNAWIVDQDSQSNASHITDLTNLISGIFGILIVVGVIGLVLFMLLKGGGNNILMSSSSPNSTPGQKGTTIAASLIVVGIILFVVGIAVIATEASTWGGVICIIGGLLIIALAGYLLWKATQIKKGSKPNQEGAQVKRPPAPPPPTQNKPPASPPPPPTQNKAPAPPSIKPQGKAGPEG